MINKIKEQIRAGRMSGEKTEQQKMYDFWSKKIRAFLDTRGYIEPQDLSYVPEADRKLILERFYRENPELPIKFDGNRLVNVAFKLPVKKSPVSVETCSICLGTIKLEAPIIRCEGCSRVYHQTCADRIEDGKCPNCGEYFRREEKRIRSKKEELLKIQVKETPRRNKLRVFGVAIAILGLIFIGYWVYTLASIATLTIRVGDSETNSFISGASIYLDGDYRGSTDSSGKITIEGLKKGSVHTVKVTPYQYDKGDYEEWRGEVYADSDKEITVYLKTKTYTLTVKVIRNKTSDYISGASAYLNGKYIGITDSYGVIKITGIKQGVYTLKVGKPGYIACGGSDYKIEVKINSDQHIEVGLSLPDDNVICILI